MTHWDKLEAQRFRKAGLSEDQIGIVIGAIAEHRQIADMNGYKRGYEQGHQNAKRKYDHDEIRTAYAAGISVN